MRTFENNGGVALNYAPVIGLLKDGKQITGVTIRDEETGQVIEARAPVVVNATGVFVDDIRRMENPQAKAMLSPSQGVHVIVDRRFLPGDSAIMIPKTEDGRVLFAVPWHDHVVIGTTDTAVPNVELEPRALNEEIDFILRTAAQYLSHAPTRQDVQSIFAGLRPLVKAAEGGETKALSRDHVIRISEGGLITLTGGKWTTYRHMGEDTVNQAEGLRQWTSRPSVTEALKLHGWTQEEQEDHWKVYGTDAAQIRQLQGSDIKLHPELPYTEAEVRWAVQMEQARTVEDVLARRLRALLLNARASEQMAPRVAAIIAEELGRDASWLIQQIGTYQALTKGYILN